jgi:four helix bundle protein
MSGIEDLEAWKQARELRKRISILVRSFPKDEKYRLTDQLIRASRSCTANIAEGYGRFHYQENIQFCRQSRGSMFECKDHIYCAFDEEFINETTFSEFKEQIENCIKIINGYILYLKNQKQNNS